MTRTDHRPRPPLQRRHVATRLLAFSGFIAPDAVSLIVQDALAECLGELRSQLGKYKLESQNVNTWRCMGGRQILVACTGCARSKASGACPTRN